MIISGLQKLTLIDYPDKIACSIFLHGCNFRCGFCHNKEIVTDNAEEMYSEREVLDFLEKRRGQLDAVCISGGEPLLSLKKDFLERIKEMGYLIKIDTNGSFPDFLKELINGSLVDYVAMDVKCPKDLYSRFTNTDLKNIERSMRILSYADIPFEFRTTISPFQIDDKIKMLGVKEILEIVEWIVNVTEKNNHSYFLQRFIPRKGELIDEGFEDFSETSDEELKEIRDCVVKIFPNVMIR